MSNPQILLVSDDQSISSLFEEKIARGGNYFLRIEADITSAVAALKEQPFDVAVVKFASSKESPIEAIKELKKVDPDLIIIGFLEHDDNALGRKIVDAGAYDFVSYPLEENKLFFLLKKGSELHILASAHRRLYSGLKEHNVSLQRQNTFLAKRVEESTKNLTRLYEDLRTTYMRTIKTLAQAIDARDHYTHSHSQNVAKVSVMIAEELNLSAKDIEIIREASELHDLGKIGVQDDILVKPAALNEEEWKKMRQHPEAAAQILQPLTFLHGVVELIQQHHEHYDGTGYPKGVKGEDIFLGARIIHLADAYEAMTSARSYRKTPLSKEAAIGEIKKYRGTQFDPKIVDVFLKIAPNL